MSKPKTNKSLVRYPISSMHGTLIFWIFSKGAKVIGEGRLDEYGEEEEDIVCLRFPHLSFCPYNY